MMNNCFEIYSQIGEPQIPQRTIERGEDNEITPYDASSNGYPSDIVFATSEDEIREEKDLESQKRYSEITKRRKYLWVLSENKILMAYENTPVENPRGFICHSNITGGRKAIIGGELWFLKNEFDEVEVHINFDSGRYKTIDAAKQHPLVYSLLKCVGYKTVKPFLS
jgi:hypothetical protein